MPKTIDYKYSETSVPLSSEKIEAVLLINIGSPDSPEVEDVKRYLKAFLNDPKVMDMPALLRKLLVNGIIVPFRAKKSARRYAQLWTKNGSPLTYHLRKLEEKLQSKLKGKTYVYSAVSYGEPSLKNTIEKIINDGITNLTVVPLYPHYAQFTTESAKTYIKKLLKGKSSIKYKFIDQFYKDEGFIKAVSAQANDLNLETYDHILFSYHSLPYKQIEKVKAVKKGEDYDYKLACEKTSKLLANELMITNYSTVYQSRFSKRWQAPYTNEVLEQLIEEGKTKVLVFTPSFVADCLETTIEIGVEYRDEFLKNGGEVLDLAPCPNAENEWVDAIANLIS